MESIKDRSTLNWTTDDRGRRTSRWRGVTLMALFVMGLISVSAFAQQVGTVQSELSSAPRGAVFLGDNTGGHWWVSDSQQGICELVPNGIPNGKPFILNFCNNANSAIVGVTSGGQIVVGDPSPTLPLPAGSKFLYIADDSIGTTVARLVFSPSANGGLGGITRSDLMSVPNVNGVHNNGVVKPGNPVGVALLPHNGPAANGGTQDLYVGYLKSGDITRIDGIDSVPLGTRTPTVVLAGATSDGIGSNSLLAFGNDLYIAEFGGFGLSTIPDPAGIARTACAPSICTAANVRPSPSFFPGGLTTDWVPGTPTTGKSIFIGDSTPARSQHSIVKYDPATAAISTYSLNINPIYSAIDPATNISTTYTAYFEPLGLGYNPATNDLLVGDDPFAAAGVVTQKGHFWKVPVPGSNPPSVTSVVDAVTGAANGSTLGGESVTITGFNLAVYDLNTGAVLFQPTISFGVAGLGVSPTCAPAAAPPVVPTPSTCTAVSPAGFGVVDVQVSIQGATSAVNPPADQFTYNILSSTAITVATVSPNTGATVGDTLVTITGQNLAHYNAATGAVLDTASFNFGAAIADPLTVVCQPTTVPVAAAVTSVCTVRSPAGAAGTVNVNASLADALGVVQTSANGPGDQFTYVQVSAGLYAWGVMAPKGGAIFLPGALGGHWWTGDEGQGFCRQDPMTTATAPFAIAGNTLHAMNFGLCADDVIGGAGQAAYDPNPIAGTTFHYIYIASNAVKSVSLFRLTFDSSTETLVADPFGGALATEMAPLSGLRTLKPNGLALGPDGNLYVSDLVEPNVRKLTTEQDPRLQSLSIIALTGDGRGANGTVGFIGNYLYISGNRAAQFIDITLCPYDAGTGKGILPCGMASVPAPALIFVAAVATDAAHKRVYLSNSPGGGPASVFRYDASGDVYMPFNVGDWPVDANGVTHCGNCTFGPTAKDYIDGGLLPAPNSPNGTVTASTTFIRPWDQNNHPTAGIAAGAPVPANFAFVFGLVVDPLTGTLAITEDPSAGGRAGRGTMWTVPFIQ